MINLRRVKGPDKTTNNCELAKGLDNDKISHTRRTHGT